MSKPLPRLLQLERVIKIDALLRTGERHTADSLGKALEVSEKTIRTDLQFLRDRLHAPLVYGRREGWYYHDLSWTLPTIPLSQGEVFALTLGAKMLSAYAGSAYHAELQSALEQLVNRLPEQSQLDLQQVANERVLFRPGAMVNLDPLVWQKLQFACQCFRSVKMRYFTAGRASESERVVDPYVLHLSNANPYLTGFCHARQAIRDFRIDRIRAIEVLAERFDIDPSFDPQAYLNRAFFHEQGGEPTQVSIWFDAPTAPYIRERTWHSTQVIEEREAGSLVLRFEARGLEEVKRWVLFYGKGAIAQEPMELVELVRQEVDGMSQHYQED
jgi:predicted DNA-binding transcriptional regulator YafY